MIVIDIENTVIKSKQGTNKEGKPWTMNFQQILISGFFIDGFQSRHPRESTIQLSEENPQPYQPGRYVVSSESFYFGDFGRFTMGRIRLQPLGEFLGELQSEFKKAA